LESGVSFPEIGKPERVTFRKTRIGRRTPFVVVQEYYGKQKSDAFYESHKKYTDIQYIIEGEEVIGLTALDKLKIKEPYNEENDIAFYDFDGGDYLKASPEKFFLFFPEDAHRPSITTGDSILVKKIVVKILID
jgi:YhcH/YjgK/YiaL family protein